MLRADRRQLIPDHLEIEGDKLDKLELEGDEPDKLDKHINKYLKKYGVSLKTYEDKLPEEPSDKDKGAAFEAVMPDVFLAQVEKDRDTRKDNLTEKYKRKSVQERAKRKKVMGLVGKIGTMLGIPPENHSISNVLPEAINRLSQRKANRHGSAALPEPYIEEEERITPTNRRKPQTPGKGAGREGFRDPRRFFPDEGEMDNEQQR